MLFLYPNGLSWIEAQGQCGILGEFLAEVKTEEEHEFLKSIITSYEVNNRFDTDQFIFSSLEHLSYFLSIFFLIYYIFRSLSENCNGG